MKWKNKKVGVSLLVFSMLLSSLLGYQFALSSVPASGPYYLDVPFGTASYYVGKFDNGSTYMVKGDTWQCTWNDPNSSAIINACIGNLTSEGTIFIKAGTYEIALSQDESYIVVEPNVWLRGEGINSTILKATGAVTKGVSVVMLRLRENSRISDLTIDMNGDNLTYDDNYVNAFWSGIIFGDVVGVAPKASVFNVEVKNAKTKAGVTGSLQGIGIALFDANGATIRDVVLTDCEWGISVSYSTPLHDYYETSNYLIDGVYAEGCTSGIIYWEIGEATVLNVRGKDNARGIYVLATTSYTTNGIIDNIKLYNCTEHAVYIGVHEANDFALSNIWVENTTSGKDGIRIVSGNVSITNPQIREAGGFGIVAIGTGNVAIIGGLVTRSGYVGIQYENNMNGTITGVTVTENGQAAANTYSGIEVTNDATGVTIIGNRIFDNQGTKTQRYGIRTSGTSDYCIITNNDVRDNLLTMIYSGSNNIVGDNQGFVTENSGTATNSTTTTFIFNHGLVGTPTGLWSSFNTTTITGWAWTATSTQITITVSGSGLPSIMATYWKTEYEP